MMMFFFIFLVLFSNSYAEETTSGGKTDVSLEDCGSPAEVHSCQRELRRCREKFRENNMEVREDFIKKCDGESLCEDSLDVFGDMGMGCVLGVVRSITETVFGVAYLGHMGVAEVKNLLNGEAFKKWEQDRIHYRNMIRPYLARIEAVCGPDPYKDPKLYEHRTAYSRNEITPREFEKGEIRLRVAKMEYPVCKYQILDQAGIFKDKKKFKNFFVGFFKSIGISVECYNNKGVSDLICNMGLYFAGVAGAAKALGRLSTKTLGGTARSGSRRNTTTSPGQAGNLNIKYQLKNQGQTTSRVLPGTKEMKRFHVYSAEVTVNQGTKRINLLIPAKKNGKVDRKAFKEAKEMMGVLPTDAFSTVESLFLSGSDLVNNLGQAVLIQ